MEKEGQIVPEKPLNGAAKLTLMLSAGATILLFYLFALFVILLLVVVLAFELVLAAILLRFGLTGLITAEMEKQVQLLGIIGRSFLLSKGAEYRIVLQPEEAPGLFAQVQQLCTRLGVTMPKEVSLEMNANAWVRLKGVRQNAGTTILGVGYDLLAGLTTREVEAVLAHEMVHARLIQRGLKQLLNGGLSRAAKLSGGLAAYMDAYERASQSAGLAGPMHSVADRLTKLAARLVAAYARQDEFEADRGAADLCGAGPIRSSLSKLDRLEAKLARLPWHERVARFQLGGGFSRWLVQELATATAGEASGDEGKVFNKYATHPLLRDRLAALPPDAGPAPEGQRPGLDLLADADAVAEKLIAEIQRVAAQEEEKDSKELRKWVRKARRRGQSNGWELAGWVLGLIGAGTGVAAWLLNELSFGLGSFAVIAVVGAVLLHRAGRYKDRMLLPVPDFALLKEPPPPPRTDEERQAAQKVIEAQLSELVATEKKSRQKAALLAMECYAALGRCDYLRAYVAARKCRDEVPDSIEGAIGMVVAAAGLQLPDPHNLALAQLQLRAGFTTPSTTWAAAWALLLFGEWARAEAFLLVVIKDRPDEPTFLMLLALCQSRRGKLQSAMLSARKACTPAPRNKEHAKLLITLLLDGGYMREAEERLQPLEAEARQDAELAFAKVRIALLHRAADLAAEWTARAKENAKQPRLLVRLGEAYEMAREDERAAGLYQEALAVGFYPEACLGLARLEANRKNHEQTRRHLLEALDVVRPLGTEATGPLPLFHRTITSLLELQEPVLNCQAWIAKFGVNVLPEVLKNQQFMVFAISQMQAEGFVRVILQAMHPGSPPPLPETIHWRQAPKQQQPDGPVRPGVQGVLN